jgi:hypothetical protein
MCVSFSQLSWEMKANRLILAVNWADAQRRVLKSYREWLRSVRPRLSIMDRQG